MVAPKLRIISEVLRLYVQFNNLKFGMLLQVDRKLVKQTVMTSVYGVTYVGAREQIKRRLEEKGLITDDRLLFAAACYAAKVSIMDPKK